MNYSVEDLKRIKFSTLCLEDKVAIKNSGRPTPPIIIKKEGTSRGKTYTRSITETIYNVKEWICGCDISEALYCFPCLLFGGVDKWSRLGMNNPQKITAAIANHDSSKPHINNSMKLSLLGTVNIKSQMSTAYHNNIIKHNKKVDKKRLILSNIINCVKFCGAFELPLRGHDEKKTSANPGVFLGLLNYTAEIDEVMKTHLESNKVFKGTSKEIQNDLLQCMLQVCRENIKNEIAQARYVSVIADETTDITRDVQLVVVFRYIDPNGDVQERFWGFLNPAGHKAADIVACLLPEIKLVIPNNPEKLICQGYDGAAVMSGAFNGVQAKIRETYKFAHYIHCYAHKTNLIMERSISTVAAARTFFSNINSIPTYFAHSAERNETLDAIVRKRVPRATLLRWVYNSRVVNSVHEHEAELYECFQNLQSSTTATDATVDGASKLIRTFDDEVFQNWLAFFHQVMPHVDLLYQQLQKKQIDAARVKQAIENFIAAIKKIREKVVDGTIIMVENEDQQQPARRRRHIVIERTQSMKSAAIEVCDVIIAQSLERFSFSDHLEAACLLHTNKFQAYEKSFPEDHFKAAMQSFPVFDEARLHTELELLYSSTDFQSATGAIPVLKVIRKNNMEEAFRETLKLLEIVITMPMSSSEAERCFSTLKRIKTFLRNSMTEERLTALAMLSIEKEMMTRIPNFNSKVIDLFAQMKDRREDFLYKK